MVDGEFVGVLEIGLKSFTRNNSVSDKQNETRMLILYAQSTGNKCPFISYYSLLFLSFYLENKNYVFDVWTLNIHVISNNNSHSLLT